MRMGIPRLKPCLLAVAIMVAVVAAACGQGTYPLDIFYEMHYQQSYKPGEPPMLSGVKGAVPVDWVPAPQSTSLNTGQHLFMVNCSMCHGQGAKGDGPVLKTMMDQYGYQPGITPDLTSPQVVAMGMEGMQGFMFSGVVVMPSFKKLLTPEEMELIAEYIMTLQ